MHVYMMFQRVRWIERNPLVGTFISFSFPSHPLVLNFHCYSSWYCGRVAKWSGGFLPSYMYLLAFGISEQG